MEPPHLSTHLHFDNRGVIIHGNSLWVTLPEKEAQADLIHHVKYLTGTSKCKATWEWVEGHAAERKGLCFCSLPKRLNDKADKLAKRAILDAISGGRGDFRGFSTRISKGQCIWHVS
jgi:hypothetical protein